MESAGSARHLCSLGCKRFLPQECDPCADSSTGMAGAASAAPGSQKSGPPILSLLHLKNGPDNGGHFRSTEWPGCMLMQSQRLYST